MRNIDTRKIESIEISPFAHIKPKTNASGKHISFNTTINVKGIPNKNNISNNILNSNFNNNNNNNNNKIYRINVRNLTQKEYTDEVKATKDKLTQIQNEINIMESKLTNKTNDDIMQLAILKNWKLEHKKYLKDLQEELEEYRVQTINYK